MNQIEQLTAWLNSAHAMETSLANTLEGHAKDARDFPEMAARLTEHMEETQRHARLIEECLATLGEKPSVIKTAAGSVMGMVQGASPSLFHDGLVKNVLADFAAEHFEIACYTSLAYAADAEGKPSIAQICREILVEEESMAAWLESQIEESTRIVLDQTATA